MTDSSKTAKVNLRELLARTENDRELLQELVSTFAGEFPHKLAALRDAVRRDDLSQVVTLSHSLKGMLSHLAVTVAASRAANLEQVALAGDKSQLGNCFRAFENEVQGLLSELQAQIAEARP